MNQESTVRPISFRAGTRTEGLNRNDIKSVTLILFILAAASIGAWQSQQAVAIYLTSHFGVLISPDRWVIWE
jgi:hypothetical protein